LAYNNDKTKPLPFKVLENRVEPNGHNKYLLRLLAAETTRGLPEMQNYKVLTDKGLCKASIKNYDWQNVTFSPLPDDLQSSSGSFIGDKVKLVKKKLLSVFSS
jgi:hypothetical protein